MWGLLLQTWSWRRSAQRRWFQSRRGDLNSQSHHRSNRILHEPQWSSQNQNQWAVWACSSQDRPQPNRGKMPRLRRDDGRPSSRASRRKQRTMPLHQWRNGGRIRWVEIYLLPHCWLYWQWLWGKTIKRRCWKALRSWLVWTKNKRRFPFSAGRLMAILLWSDIILYFTVLCKNLLNSQISSGLQRTEIWH